MIMRRHTTIYQDVRIRLGLTLIQYGVLDSIEKLATGRSRYQGWCHASKKYLADTFGVTEPTIYKAIKELEKKDLIKRHATAKSLLKPTEFYKIILYARKESSVYPGNNLGYLDKVNLDNSNNIDILVKENKINAIRINEGDLTSIKKEGDSTSYSEVIRELNLIHQSFFECGFKSNDNDFEIMNIVSYVLSREQITEIFYNYVNAMWYAGVINHVIVESAFSYRETDKGFCIGGLCYQIKRGLPNHI